MIFLDDGNKFNSSISSAFGNGTINQKNFEQAQFMNPSVFSSSRSSTYCNDNTFVKPTSFAVSRSSIIGGYTQNNSSQLTFNSSFQTMNGRIQQIKDPTQFLSNYQQTMPPNTSNFGGGFGSSNNSQRYFNNSFSFATNPSINNERKTSFKNDLKDEPMNMDPPSLKSFGSVKQNWLSFENSQNSLNKYKR